MHYLLRTWVLAVLRSAMAATALIAAGVAILVVALRELSSSGISSSSGGNISEGGDNSKGVASSSVSIG